MNTLNQEPSEREQVEALLPWHAAGTLSRGEAERVERALASDRDLAREFELIREEFHETIHLNESLGTPSTRAAQKLFAAIEAEGARAPRRASFDIAGRLSAFISGFAPKTLAYAAAAGALAIIVQAAVLTDLAVKGNQTGSSFGLASKSSSDGPAIMVRFAPQATASEITAFLGAYKAEMVSGPRSGNFYQIRVPGLNSPADISSVVEKMQKESNIVAFVAARE
ncbi:MAG TPA: hypothetical protein VH684_26690 [Xanthobacteraceae bacterium]|jgi:hypothetical protein